MKILQNNKFKIQAAFVKSLFIVDNKLSSKLKIHEKQFLEKLLGFLPIFDLKIDSTILNKVDSLCLYHKSHQCPSEPEILVKLLWFEEEENGAKKCFIKIQF